MDDKRQATMEPLWRGVEAEAIARDTLQKEQLQHLREALTACGLQDHTTAWRLAMMIYHLCKNTGGGLAWTAERIAADQAMAMPSGQQPAVRTIRAAAGALRRHGLIRQHVVAVRGRGVKYAERSIDWGGVQSARQTARQTTCQTGRQTARQTTCQTARQTTRQNRPPTYSVLPEVQETTTSTWEAVAGDLIGLGVYGRTAEHLAAALEASADPQHVRAVLDVYRTAAGWSPGALVDRLRLACRRVVDPAEGWPPRDTTAATDQVHARRRAAAAVEHQAATVAASADRLEADRLEADHGPRLNDLAPGERDALAAQVLEGFALARYRSTWQRPGSAARRQLLEALDGQAVAR